MTKKVTADELREFIASIPRDEWRMKELRDLDQGARELLFYFNPRLTLHTGLVQRQDHAQTIKYGADFVGRQLAMVLEKRLGRQLKKGRPFSWKIGEAKKLVPPLLPQTIARLECLNTVYTRMHDATITRFAEDEDVIAAIDRIVAPPPPGFEFIDHFKRVRMALLVVARELDEAGGHTRPATQPNAPPDPFPLPPL